MEFNAVLLRYSPRPKRDTPSAATGPPAGPDSSSAPGSAELAALPDSEEMFGVPPLAAVPGADPAVPIRPFRSGRSGRQVRAARACPVDHGTGSRSQMLIEATSMVPW